MTILRLAIISDSKITQGEIKIVGEKYSTYHASQRESSEKQLSYNNYT